MRLRLHLLQIKIACLSHDTLEPILEPFRDLFTLDTMRSTYRRLAATTLRDTFTRPSHAAIEVHAVNANRWVVLDT